jgi:hypothetical protein
LVSAPVVGHPPEKPWQASVAQCRPRRVGCAARKPSSPAVRRWLASCRLSVPRRRLEEVFVNCRGIFNYRWSELASGTCGLGMSRAGVEAALRRARMRAFGAQVRGLRDPRLQRSSSRGRAWGIVPRLMRWLE